MKPDCSSSPACVTQSNQHEQSPEVHGCLDAEDSCLALIPWQAPEKHFTWRTRTLLGRGRFATAWLTHRLSDRKPVVVKFLDAKIIRKNGHEGWFSIMREINIARRISHPLCVKMVDAFHHDNNVFLVMEYVDGKELFDYLIERQTLAERDARVITQQLLQVTCYLHSEGIVHRDIKPENILINPTTKRITLLDFGAAKLRKASSGWPLYMLPKAPTEREITQHQYLNAPGSPNPTTPILDSPVGTLRYMPPENLNVLSKDKRGQAGKRITDAEALQKVDLYSIGTVLYIMLGGKFPYKSCPDRTSFQTVAKKILIQIDQRGVQFPDSNWGSVSAAAKDLVFNMMNPDKHRRYSTKEALNHVWFDALNKNTKPTSTTESSTPCTDPNSNDGSNTPSIPSYTTTLAPPAPIPMPIPCPKKTTCSSPSTMNTSNSTNLNLATSGSNTKEHPQEKQLISSEPTSSEPKPTNSANTNIKPDSKKSPLTSISTTDEVDHITLEQLDTAVSQTAPTCSNAHPSSEHATQLHAHATSQSHSSVPTLVHVPAASSPTCKNETLTQRQQAFDKFVISKYTSVDASPSDWNKCQPQTDSPQSNSSGSSSNGSSHSHSHHHSQTRSAAGVDCLNMNIQAHADGPIAKKHRILDSSLSNSVSALIIQQKEEIALGFGGEHPNADNPFTFGKQSPQQASKEHRIRQKEYPDHLFDSMLHEVEGEDDGSSMLCNGNVLCMEEKEVVMLDTKPKSPVMMPMRIPKMPVKK